MDVVMYLLLIKELYYIQEEFYWRVRAMTGTETELEYSNLRPPHTTHFLLSQDYP